MIQLIAHLRDVAFRDRRCDHVIVDVRDLRVGEKAGECTIIEIEHFAVLLDRHKYGDRLTVIIDTANFKFISIVRIFFLKLNGIAHCDIVLIRIRCRDIHLVLLHRLQIRNLNVFAVIGDTVG